MALAMMDGGLRGEMEVRGTAAGSWEEREAAWK